MVICVDNKDGVLGIRIKNFEDRFGNYYKYYQRYNWCDPKIKEQIIPLLEKALDRVKNGALTND